MGKEKTKVRNQIRTLRFHAHEMTQQELADRIGVTRQTVNAIEKGKFENLPHVRSATNLAARESM